MPGEKMRYDDLMRQIDSLVLYRNIRKDKLIKRLCALCRAVGKDKDAERLRAAFIRELIEIAESLRLTGSVWQQYAARLFLQDENGFSLACENKADVKGSSAYQLALREMECLQQLVDLNMESVFGSYAELFAQYVPMRTHGRHDEVRQVGAEDDPYPTMLLAASSAEERLAVLIAHYTERGCGIFAAHRMFRYDGGFVAVRHCDPVVFSDLIGCGPQKEILARNTEAFIEGLPANNMLLVGSRGTGKSSCVKALVNEYFDRGIRLLEVSKEQMVLLPGILKELSGRGKRFILFMDDLSFEDFEIEYKYMKSLLEGGTENKPDNVVFYATSNRRHIIREKWDDRNEQPESEEVHTTDTLNEKLSLSDRFGITVTFPKPGPDEYLRIVMGIAAKEGIDAPEEWIKQQALQWEISQKGMSGRTARQFINHIKGRGWKI